jgi:hypothetical protein
LPQDLFRIRKKIPLVEHDEVVAEPVNDKNTTNSQGGAKPARRFITRTTATGRKKQEASLTTAIRIMELDLNPENVNVHEVLLHLLENLETEHHNFVMKESLDINMEPEKSYMLEF